MQSIVTASICLTSWPSIAGFSSSLCEHQLITKLSFYHLLAHIVGVSFTRPLDLFSNNHGSLGHTNMQPRQNKHRNYYWPLKIHHQNTNVHCTQWRRSMPHLLCELGTSSVFLLCVIIWSKGLTGFNWATKQNSSLKQTCEKSITGK